MMSFPYTVSRYQTSTQEVELLAGFVYFMDASSFCASTAKSTAERGRIFISSATTKEVYAILTGQD